MTDFWLFRDFLAVKRLFFGVQRMLFCCLEAILLLFRDRSFVAQRLFFAVQILFFAVQRLFFGCSETVFFAV